MRVLQALLFLCTLALAAYTLPVWLAHGPNFTTAYAEGVAAWGWHGQFTLDFTVYLALSAGWIAWRHRFSAKGLGLALAASVWGLLFLGPYLIWASWNAAGMEQLLLGERHSP